MCTPPPPVSETRRTPTLPCHALLPPLSSLALHILDAAGGSMSVNQAKMHEAYGEGVGMAEVIK
jgi:hypothetical protein